MNRPDLMPSGELRLLLISTLISTGMATERFGSNWKTLGSPHVETSEGLRSVRGSGVPIVTSTSALSPEPSVTVPTADSGISGAYVWVAGLGAGAEDATGAWLAGVAPAVELVEAHPARPRTSSTSADG